MNDAIRQARYQKLARLQEAQAHAQPAAGESPDAFTAASFLAYVSALGRELGQREAWPRPFRFDADNLLVYQQLAAYFTGDYSVVQSDLNPHRGLLIFGGLGVGKTVLMKLFAANPLRGYRVLDAATLARDYAERGEAVFHEHGNLLPTPSRTRHFGQTHLGLCIDDLGQERRPATSGRNGT